MAVNIRSKERKHPFIDVKQRCSQTPSHAVSFPRFGFGTHGSYRDTVVIYNVQINNKKNIYIYYGYWVQRKIINCRRQNLRRECIWMIFLMATWDVCFRVFFCFHSWFRTCVPCLYLDHLGPPCLKGGVLKAVRPSPSWVSSPRALFLIDFF